MLYEHQKLAIRNCIVNPRYALYHEQGLGKTITAIISADYYINARGSSANAVVICPAFLQQNWKNEIERWSKFKDRYTVYSYNTFIGVPTQFWPAHYLIIDEAHYIKNRRAQRTRAVVNAAMAAKRVILLTGTPVGNRNILDLYTHLICLDPTNSYAKYSNFRDKFMRAKNHRFDKEKSCNEGEFLSILSKFSERRLKVDCLDLPEKIYHVIPCEGMRVHKNLHVLHKMQLQTGIDVHLRDKDTNTLIESIPSTSKKIETLVQLVGCINPESQIVIYVAFRKSIELVKEALKKETIEEFHGGLTLAQKEAVLKHFRAGKFRILIPTIQSLSEGATLTNCNTVIYLDRTFSNTQIAQSEDRFHRIGQKYSVDYYNIVSNGIDKKAYEMLKQNKSFDEITKEIENAE